MLRRLLLQSSFLTLAGCSILPERPPLKLYSISLGAPTYRNSISKRRLSSVRVNPPMVAEPYDSSKIYVLGEDNRMFNTEISQLVSTPSQIIAAAIREKLSAGGPWRIVLLPNSIAQFDYQLTIFISSLTRLRLLCKPRLPQQPLTSSFIKDNSAQPQTLKKQKFLWQSKDWKMPLTLS